MLGHRERDRRQPRHYVISLYLAVVIAAHALALLVCSMCSPLMAVGILLNLRVNAVFPLYWRYVNRTSQTVFTNKAKIKEISKQKFIFAFVYLSLLFLL